VGNLADERNTGEAKKKTGPAIGANADVNLGYFMWESSGGSEWLQKKGISVGGEEGGHTDQEKKSLSQEAEVK